MATRWQDAPLSEADRALCAFAVKLAGPPDRMTPADLDTLREHGFDDRAIHDAVQVISYFSYINRIADALGVEPEGWVREWEK